MAFFEWGLNWAIAQHALQYLIIHSAVVEKNGRAIIFPGVPGAGKSTLCAAMVHHGWRLLSDEQALITEDAAEIVPLARPINLKNQSIDIIRDFCPDAKFGQVFKQTSKGSICHVKPPLDAIAQLTRTAKPFAIIFPSYDREQTDTNLSPLDKGSTLIELISHCFNYTILGLDGFKRATKLVEQSHCCSLSYSDLASAIQTLDQLHER
jgi:HprK-related kinase A